MKKIALVIGILLVGIGTALTYHIFENVVHEVIDLIWYDWFDTDNNRALVIPLAVILSLVFYGAQHALDSQSEAGHERGLGDMPKPTVRNYLRVLVLGFFSLIAGATLGPEAILVPACMILGAMIGTRISSDQRVIKLLTVAGMTALFTAFFHSALVGILSLALIIHKAKVKLSVTLFVTAVIASVMAYLTLLVVDGQSYVAMPDQGWGISAGTIWVSLVLAVAGYLMILGMNYVDMSAGKLLARYGTWSWWSKALLASAVISLLYLLGGPLVEFTGNRSIIPMFDQAETLGLVGLLWILIVKVGAIAWSKTVGYRGGMIFPTIFLAAVLSAIAQLYVDSFNSSYGIVAVIVGALAANRKNHILA